jgi:serine/threonine-protein kinase
MATVYLARDLRHGRRVALKVLHPALAVGLGTERFLREVRIAAALQHPHILPVHDSGEAAGQLYYVMPYVEGETLRSRLDREGPLPVDEAVRLGREVLDALGYAHRHGVVHRDIKPENILLSDGHALVADFGIAKALVAAGEERLTETGWSVGTPPYMSPEQIGGEAVDGRSDLYALGCVLQEMLTGEPPFTGAAAQELFAKHVRDRPPALRTRRPEVPPAVEQAIGRALAKAPQQRFPTAGEFAAALGTPPGIVSGPVAWGRLARIATMVGLGLGLLAGALLLWRIPTASPTDPNLLAVAPFDVLAPSLQLWHEGLADVLSRSLDGAGPLRTVSQTVALRHWRGRADRASAEALGRRTGAGLVVFGAVVPRGPDSVSLRAGVLDGTRGETEVEISGQTDRMGELADSLSFKILQALGRSRPIGSVREVSIGSRSLPALKAFLQGEQFYRRGLWDSALVQYNQAISADSAFALAYYRMTLVLGWNPPSAGAYRPGEVFARHAMLLNHGLPPRESLLIAAGSLAFPVNDDASEGEFPGPLFRSMAALEEAVRRYPEDPEAWYALGEARYHMDAPIGTPPARVLEAFNRAIGLDSGFAPAYEHMVGLNIAVGRPDQAEQYAVRSLRLDPTGEGAASLRLAALMLDLTQARQPETSRLIDSASVHAIFGAAMEHLGRWPDTAETAVRLFRALGEKPRAAGGDAPWVLDTLMWRQYLAQALAFRGHLHEAYETDRFLLLHPDASPFSPFADPFLGLSLLGVVPDSVAGATFEHALEPGTPWHNALGYSTRYLKGLPWWLARRDTVSLSRLATRAEEAARRAKAPREAMGARLIGSVAAAYLALARGDSVEALRRLEAAPDTLCLADGGSICGHAKLTLAGLFAARGENRRAADLLDTWRWDVGGPSFVFATLERGRLAERLGERDQAIDCYRFVTAVWLRADEALQPYVAEARASLARLGTP